MAKKLKDYYDHQYVENLFEKLKSVSSQIDKEEYYGKIPANYDDLTFLKRQDVLAEAIDAGIRRPYTNTLDLFRLMWGEELEKETGMFTQGWWLWPLGRYVEKHALEDMEETMSFAHDFTKRHTGEFMVRPILINHTRYLMETFLKWSQDENVHVRRLSSEGIRISLPWAVKTTVALNEPELFEQILTNLNKDTSKFIQKSVGNNINDLYKMDLEFANKIIEKWEKDNPSTATSWIINHGRRNQK